MSVEIVAELATAHGGDVDLACDMVAAAADAGAHTVKIQSYTLASLNPRDPQADWLTQAHLDEAAHERIMNACETYKVRFLSTPFDGEALNMLRTLGCTRFKFASTTALGGAFLNHETVIKSWPWGRKGGGVVNVEAHLTAIPLYPTPLEAVSAAPLLDGWSDHTTGLWACRHMISRGAKIIEVHFCLPGRSRECLWDKDPSDVGLIRTWADNVATMTTGVATHFRERWHA